MGLTAGLLATWQVVLAGVLLLGALVMAYRYADWPRLLDDPALQHSFLGAGVVLAVLWQLRAGLLPGLSIHIFAITAVTLMLGWALAFYAGMLALALTVLTGVESVQLFAVTGLITVIVPVLVSHGIMLLERRHGFRNFFAYIFICGFFGAGLAVAIAGCTMVGLLWLSGAYSGYELVHDYVQYLPLIIFPEAFINGTIVASLMVSYPDRLSTLDQRRYL